MTMTFCCVCERENEKANFFGYLKSNKHQHQTGRKIFSNKSKSIKNTEDKSQECHLNFNM